MNSNISPPKIEINTAFTKGYIHTDLVQLKKDYKSDVEVRNEHVGILTNFLTVSELLERLKSTCWS